MNHRQRRFVVEYLVDANCMQAAIRAGYSPRTAKSASHQLMLNPEISAAVGRAMAARAQRTGITVERVLEEYARLAFAELRAIARWSKDGLSLTAAASLTPEDAAAIAEIAFDGDGKAISVRLHDKLAALAALARRMGAAPALANGHAKDEVLQRIAVLAGAG